MTHSEVCVSKGNILRRATCDFLGLRVQEFWNLFSGSTLSLASGNGAGAMDARGLGIVPLK